MNEDLKAILDDVKERTKNKILNGEETKYSLELNNYSKELGFKNYKDLRDSVIYSS